jgi:tripartite-type tricarboxylate transporter receptor subunit TctC
VFAPVKISPEVEKKLQEKLAVALANPELKKKLADLAVSITPITGEDFSNFIREEDQKYKEMVASANLHTQ